MSIRLIPMSSFQIPGSTAQSMIPVIAPWLIAAILPRSAGIANQLSVQARANLASFQVAMRLLAAKGRSSSLPN